MDSDVCFQQIKARYLGNHTTEWAELIESKAIEFPEHGGIQAILADHLLWRGDLERSSEVADKAAALSPHEPTVIAVLGTLAAYRGEDLEAARLYKEALELEPTNIFGLANYPFILQKLGKMEEAEPCIERLRTIYPNEGKVVALLSYFPLMQGDLVGVEEILSSYTGPESDRVCVAWARLYTRRNDWVKSEEMARRAVQINPECSAGWEHLCILYRHQGRSVESKQAAEFALSGNSRSVPALRELAKIALKEGDKSLAKEYELRADSATPIGKEINRIGKESLKLMEGRDPRLLDRLMTELPTSTGMEQSTRLTGLIQFFELEPDHHRCAEFLALAQGVAPKSVDLIVLESMHLRKMGRTAEAISLVHETLATNPSAAALLCEQVASYCSTNQLDLAKVAANALLEVGINSPFMFHKVVIPLLDAEMIDEAQKFYEQLALKYPDSQAADQMKMVISISNGDLVQGLRLFAKHGGQRAQATIGVTLVKFVLLLPVLAVKLVLFKLGIIKRKNLK